MLVGKADRNRVDVTLKCHEHYLSFCIHIYDWPAYILFYGSGSRWVPMLLLVEDHRHQSLEMTSNFN